MADTGTQAPEAATAADYAVVRGGVGLVDRSDLGVLEVTGRDRAAFLHAMLSNDVKGLGPGQGCGAALLDVHGRVQALVVLLALDDRILVLTPPGRAADLLEALDRYLFAEKAGLRDASGEPVLFMLAGPDAPALAARLGGAAVPETAWAHVQAEIAGVAVRVARGGGETGESEVWVMAPGAAGAAVRQALLDAGAKPVGAGALEALRIEAGTPRFGQDADPSVLLPEIPHQALVSSTKGCYLGQEVVVRIRDRGHVNRLLRGLLIDGAEVPAPGARLLADGAEVGHVTSAAWSPGLGRPVSLAFVRRQHADPGTTLSIEAADGPAGATVSALPFAR